MQTIYNPANLPQSGSNFPAIPPLCEDRQAANRLSAPFKGIKTRFSSETAKAAAELSRRKREAIKEANAMLAKEAAEARAKLAAETPQSGRIATQLKRIEEMMEDETDPDTLLKLSGAHARLFSAWQVLTGTPNPGARRSGKRERAPAIQPEPMAETPQSAPVSPVTTPQ